MGMGGGSLLLATAVEQKISDITTDQKTVLNECITQRYPVRNSISPFCTTDYRSAGLTARVKHGMYLR